MKYLPLVWAALMRKPARAILTLLSVIVAFTLFGIMIGVNAGLHKLVDDAKLNRIIITPRYAGTLTLSQRDQIARVDGVTDVGALGVIGGYHEDRKNNALSLMFDEGMRHVWTEVPLTPQRYAQLKANRGGAFISQAMAARFHVKVGDIFPIITQNTPRADGSTTWPFTILGIIADIETIPTGYMLGDFDYLDQARAPKDRSNVLQYRILIRDPARADETAKAIDRLFANSAAPTKSTPEKILFENSIQSGIDLGFVTLAVAGAGLFMILFLTGNNIAQSVRERIPEFAVLKTLGFSDTGVTALVFAEAVLPCLLGAVIGLSLARGVVAAILHFLPPIGLPLPRLSPDVLVVAFAAAVLIAFASAVLPALRIKRLDVATALSGR